MDHREPLQELPLHLFLPTVQQQADRSISQYPTSAMNDGIIAGFEELVFSPEGSPVSSFTLSPQQFCGPEDFQELPFSSRTPTPMGSPISRNTPIFHRDSPRKQLFLLPEHSPMGSSKQVNKRKRHISPSSSMLSHAKRRILDGELSAPGKRLLGSPARKQGLPSHAAITRTSSQAIESSSSKPSSSHEVPVISWTPSQLASLSGRRSVHYPGFEICQGMQADQKENVPLPCVFGSRLPIREQELDSPKENINLNMLHSVSHLQRP